MNGDAVTAFILGIIFTLCVIVFIANVVPVKCPSPEAPTVQITVPSLIRTPTRL